MEWKAAALGNASGKVVFNGAEYCVEAGEEPVSIGTLSGEDELILTCEGGKFTDNEDSFLFVYTAVRPSSENISLSASSIIELSCSLSSRVVMQ